MTWDHLYQHLIVGLSIGCVVRVSEWVFSFTVDRFALYIRTRISNPLSRRNT